MHSVCKTRTAITRCILQPALILNSSLYMKQQRNYTYKGIYLFPGPHDMDLDDGGKKPDGVPDSWTTVDIDNTDFGIFDEDTFPPAKEGENLEDYCRRVPNIWSPCSRSHHVVDVIAHYDLIWAQDRAPSRLGMLETPLVKIPPESSDWHVTYQPDYESILHDIMFRTRPFPIKVQPKEFDIMLEKFTKGIQEKGIDYHFKARSFHEFWKELTGEDLKDIVNIPTWEEEIDKRIALAKSQGFNSNNNQI